MGHGKETPRQKMIGMMYLVLTCLLALNVSKDVLNAFFLVNGSLNETTKGFNEKTSILYDALFKAAAENKTKAGPWNEKATQVKIRTQRIIDSLQLCKDTIMAKADNLKGKNIDIVKPDSISSKDNNNVPAEIMVGSTGKGLGTTMKNSIAKYREFLLSVAGKDSGLIKSIEKTLETADPKMGADGIKHTWEAEHFEHLPLIAVVTILTQLQAAVRNTESDVIAYLLSRVDAGSFKFNKLQSTVIPNSTYIMQGGEYKAQIFLAASDSTQVPEIYIGDYDSLGPNNLKMRGGAQKVELDPKTHVCTYTVKGSAIGEKKYKGVINIKSPTGSILSYSFKQSYQVAASSLVISPTKMNVFYIGVENPVDISVPGVASNKLSASISQGSITQAPDGSYNVKVNNPGTCTINVSAKMDGGVKPMGSKEFRVKKVPNPIAKIAGKSGGPIAAGLLMAVKRVDAVMENFDFALTFNITGFNISTKSKDGFTIDKPATGAAITSEQRSLLEGVKRGQKLYFEDIKAVGPDKTVRELGTLMFKVE
jgi:gliding motility-associated protein GldM